MRQYTNSVVNKFDTVANGNAGAGRTITVRVANGFGTGEKAAITDKNNVELSNPFNTDENGNYTFKAIDGTYDIIISEENKDQKIILPFEQIANTIDNIPTDVSDLVKKIISVAAMKADPTISQGDYIQTIDYYSTQRGGGAKYLIKTITQASSDGDIIDGKVNHTIDGGLLVAVFNERENDVTQSGAGSSISDNGLAFQSALDYSRRVSVNRSQTEIYNFETPVKLRSFTDIKGEGVASTFDVNFFKGGLTKSANTPVTITNPERPSVTVDVMFYPDGEYEDGNFPQTFGMRGLSVRNEAPQKVGANFYYILQGSSTVWKNMNILDFQYAFNSYETWSSYFEKVKTNGKFSFNRGTSIVMNQCASLGQSIDGTIWGGFEFNEVRYSNLISCSSDNVPDTAYTFTNCFQFVMSACGSEFTQSLSDDLGSCCAFKGGNQLTVNNYYGVVRQHQTRACFSVVSDKIVFNGGKLVNIDSGGGVVFDNFDLAVTGNGAYVEFNQTQFNNNSYDDPKIRFNVGVSNSFVIVRGVTSSQIPKVYYSDGTGATLVRMGVVDSGSNANGTYIKYDDGTLVCTHTLPKDDFLAPSPYSSLVQGINWYRSEPASWLYPEQFISVNAIVNIQPRMGAGGTRLAWSRYSDTGETNTKTGEIQLIGVEDWTLTGQAYIDLIDVQLVAYGRWK